LLTCLGYAGGVYYSLVSDNFHDFFTEYIPFGEDAVLYFEEREFRRRYPNVTSLSASRQKANNVTIPSGSGVTWKVAEETGPQQKGRHVSALKDDTRGSHYSETQARERTGPESSRVNLESQKIGNVNTETSPSATNPPGDKNEPMKEMAKSQTPTSDAKGEQEGKLIAVETIDPLEIGVTGEQVVQDLVKVINNIITVINVDNAGAKYSSAIELARAELSKIGSKVALMRDVEKEAAEKKIKGLHEEFDKAAKELVKRLEEEMHDQEVRWKDEFESERERLSQSYQNKLQTELERSNEVAEKRLHNELLEQAINMKRKFIEDVKDRVEQERDARLGKLSELSTSVSELEKLTTGWNEVVDANLKTQHLHVAVEAVRSSLDKPDRPSPFVRELAALKEIAHDDPVVNAAIASINPIAYQRGVATSAQLVDRFRHVADEVRKASLLPEGAGILSHAASVLLSKFLFKKKGLAVGDDVESILTRTETLLEEGDLDSAAREMNGLTGWAKTLSRDWLAEVRRVLEVQQALDVGLIPINI
jgi:mitofilin